MTVKAYIADVGFLCEDLEKDGGMFGRLRASLSAKRQEKIDKFRYSKGKAQSLGAGLLMDYGLLQYGLREKNVRVLYGKDEKPYLGDYPEIHFNLSHSGTMAMAVFADREVGCDVEQIGRPDFRIVRRFFAEDEEKALEEQGNEEAKKRMFYRFWTLKESFLKVTGKGIRMPLNDFSISLGMPVLVRQKGESQDYGFQEFSLPGYQAAVCVERPEGELAVELQFLMPEDFLSQIF